jgi:protein-S-isoprenylcysteine O-methyltransferase Ste14
MDQQSIDARHATPTRHTSVVPQEGALTEWLLRVFALLTFGVFIYNATGLWWSDPSRVTILLLVLTESFTVCLVLFARRALIRDLSPFAVAATVYAVLFFALLRYSNTNQLAPEWFGATLQMAGLAWQVLSKATLGRAFGLLPASRGLVTNGPYRVVRHPIYLGYLIAHIGFLLTNFCWWNLLILASLYAAQVVRMQREEAMLSEGEHRNAYETYRAQVKYRLIPHVY